MNEPETTISGDSKEAVAYALLILHLYKLPTEEQNEIKKDSNRFQNLYVDFYEAAGGFRPEAD